MLPRQATGLCRSVVHAVDDATLCWRGMAGSRRFARLVPPNVAPDPVLSLGLLVAQAGAAYRRWTGHPAPLATMSAAALHELSHASD